MTNTVAVSVAAVVALWCDLNGEIVCSDHGGSYLRAAVDARPEATTHRTPITTWQRMTSVDLDEFAATVGAPASCWECS